ncbi:glycosyltransferase [Lacrimispora celerecrescens]|uniref:UDP-N-acetylglucosamine transferase subunit ALG13 n=1 Tax=[Clostridium] celerecrescens 18A TaxID=1286362 RepID=A0A2M8Z8V7_9FIRM|nr:glycosyltransferase [Lacrimispora celerecrescens]PJJ29888.1 UDP-N-acetylglucosamine transferase subunit ALG13 [[Clostridium] celerecrescens 18A]
MIFVTVGTHEQQFNRLVEYMDKWAERHDEKVIIQSGYSTYEPKIATWSKLFPYSKMVEMVEEARIVITHGGPSSFIMPLQIGKTPVVVPRKHSFNEHVNDHQVKFCKEVESRMGTILVVEDVENLGTILENYDKIKNEGKNTSNNAKFNADLSEIVNEMFEEKIS